MGTTALKGHDWRIQNSDRSLFRIPRVVDLGFVSGCNPGLQPGFHLSHYVISGSLVGVTVFDGFGERRVFYSELGEAGAGHVQPLAEGGLTDQPFACVGVVRVHSLDSIRLRLAKLCTRCAGVIATRTDSFALQRNSVRSFSLTLVTASTWHCFVGLTQRIVNIAFSCTRPFKFCDCI